MEMTQESINILRYASRWNMKLKRWIHRNEIVHRHELNRIIFNEKHKEKHPEIYQ